MTVPTTETQKKMWALRMRPDPQSSCGLMFIYIVFGLSFGLAGLVANMLVLTRWFVRYRGVAVGILLMGASFGGAVFPLIVRQTLIDSGWREAVGLLAVIGAALMILPLIFMVRNRPQDSGLNPDGAAQVSEPSTATPSVSPVASGPKLIDALKSPVFYLLAFTTATLWFCIVGVLQHQAIYLGRDLGVDKANIPLVFSAFFWAGIVGKAGFGYLSDRLNKVHVMLASIINLAIGLIVLRTINADSTVMIFTYALIYGMGAGGAFAMIQLVIADYFAGQAYGKILGIFTFVDTMAGALGTQVIGAMRGYFRQLYPGPESDDHDLRDSRSLCRRIDAAHNEGQVTGGIVSRALVRRIDTRHRRIADAVIKYSREFKTRPEHPKQRMRRRRARTSECQIRLACLLIVLTAATPAFAVDCSIDSSDIDRGPAQTFLHLRRIRYSGLQTRGSGRSKYSGQLRPIPETLRDGR